MKPDASAPPALPQRHSLVAQTVHSLRLSLTSGVWLDVLPGERELCSRLQISRPTLRAALEELEAEGWFESGERRRRRVKQGRAAAASTFHTRVIGAISSRPLPAMSPASVCLVDELRASLARADFSLELHVSTACYTATPARALETLVAHSPAAAWVIFGAMDSIEEWFVQSRVPCLIVGSCGPGMALPSVDADYRATCRHAGGMLRRKGHRRIALVVPKSGLGGDIDSETGFLDAMAVDDTAFATVLRHDGTAAHLCLLLDKSLRAPHPPTAYVVARAMHTVTVMMYLTRRGLRVPEDVAVVSRDDDVFLQHTVPALARYSINPLQFGRRVSALARQLVENGSVPPRAHRLMSRFVPGGSA